MRERTGWRPRLPPALPALRLLDERGGATVGFKPIALDAEHQFSEFVSAVRLHQVGIRAKIVSAIDVVGLVRGSENSDEQPFEPRLLAQPAKNVEAVEFGHLEIEEHQVWQRIGVAVSEPVMAFEIVNRFL